MAVLITERNARTLATSKDSQDNTLVRAARVFDVTGVASGAEALTELATRVSDPIAIGSPHPQDNTATVYSIDQTENSIAGMWTFTVGYSNKAGGGGDAVLLEPPIISIKPYRYIIMSDRDANDVPFVNTAGFPYEGGTPVEKRGIKWQLSRWESVYPWAVDWDYGGKINDNTITLPGIPVSILEGQAKFEGVEQGERSQISPVIRCTYTFDIRESHTNDVIDQGEMGWAEVDGVKVPGLFCAPGNPRETIGVVRLNGVGRAIGSFDVSLKGKGSYTDAAPPEASPSEEVVNDDLSTTDLTVLSFAIAKKVTMTITL